LKMSLRAYRLDKSVLKGSDFWTLIPMTGSNIYFV
jgi:hypothetical protein